MKVLEAEDLWVRYQNLPVLTEISFGVEKGDYLGIVGPNGSGKTTLIRCSLGLVPPAAGTIRLFGEPVDRFAQWSKVGYVPQVAEGTHMGFPATAEEIVATGLLSTKSFPRRYTKSDGHAVDKVMELLDIENLKGKMISRLSGGQRQRVFLARALIAGPELLLLDEPSAALDPTTRERFYEILENLNRKENKTIIIITHDMGTIGRYAKKMLYLDRKVVFFGTFKEFCGSQSMTRYFGEHAQHMICHQHQGFTLDR